jgi:type II secretory pathway predicted ATPase ExeA
LTNPIPETHAQDSIERDLLGSAVPPRPPDAPNTAAKPLAPATAGQQTAGTALREAMQERRPIILLFGETGVGKSTLIQSVLAVGDNHQTIPLYLSATSGEFVGPPTFDAFLNAICQRLLDSQPGRERPAVLAALAAAVSALARAGRTIVLAVDHADHLTDKMISDLIKLPSYLDTTPDNLLRIFIGSPALASRLDGALRKPGAVDRRFVEIRLPQPTAEEVATLLAYEDMAQPGGPMLTAGAIDRISTYAKSNLHWAVPLADAARALALHQGEREVTPELVGGALLELWPPGQQAALAAELGSGTSQQQGLSDVAPAGFISSADDPAPGAIPGSSSAAQPFGPVAAPTPPRSNARLLRWPWIVAAASILAAGIGLFALIGTDNGQTTLREQSKIATDRGPAIEPVLPQPSEPAAPSGTGEGSVQQSPTQEAIPAPAAPPAPATEPATNEPAEERAAAAPPAQLVPKAAVKSQAPSAAKTPPAKKAATKSRSAKRTEESPANQWIQRR